MYYHYCCFILSYAYLLYKITCLINIDVTNYCYHSFINTHTMKRSADGGEKGGAQAGNGGALKGMPGNGDSTVQPIERPLKLEQVTLHFSQTSWEEIGPGELKYIPLCQSPYYMFDEAMKNQLAKFTNFWSTAYLHKPKVRLSNLIMLQDDLINQGGTPLETTAFTQACYMMTYCPSRQYQYFTLGTITDCKTGLYNTLIYNLDETKCNGDVSQLITITNYEDFEKLAIMPAKVDTFGGYQPAAKIEVDIGQLAYIKNTYISPNSAGGDLSAFSANMQPMERSTAPILPPTVPSLKHITWARNLDKLSFHKYGDVIEHEIETNLEGVPLINVANNNIMQRQQQVDDFEKVNTYKFYTDFVWPGNNRPYYSRRDNLSTIGTFESVKKFKPLKHMFLTMPPIRKANGALLKQRCSFLMEQTFSITFHTTESIFDGDTDKFILNQTDGVIVRPVLYGRMSASKLDQGAICPAGSTMVCKDPSKCPFDNSWSSLVTLWVNANKAGGDYKFVQWGVSCTGKEFKVIPQGKLTETLMYSTAFKTAWGDWIQEIAAGSTKPFCVLCGERAGCIITDKDGQTYADEAESATAFYIAITVARWKQTLNLYGISCVPASTDGATIQSAEFNPVSRETPMFYM